MGKKFEPIAIGKLERFVGDYAIENNIHFDNRGIPNGNKVAIIGSGPSGLTCAKDLLSMGYEVTIFEALHELGGVLVYGIPSFRLPKDSVVKKEVESVQRLGAKFEKDVVVGRTITIDELMKREGFKAVFIGTGAGFPMMLNVPGENLCGVVSANEFLTRNNLLFSYKEGYETPNYVGKKVAVVGGGNVAMDAARTALRLGAEVHIVYRRSEAELPARVEEVHHAKEEGVLFDLLTAPVEVLGDENGWVNGFKCIRCELGEPDASGRRSPVPVEGKTVTLDVDQVIVAVGVSPNPLVPKSIEGLELGRKNTIVVNEGMQSARSEIFAGGDIVRGGATVILAMGDGRCAAQNMDEYLQSK
jgi:glutamate synthase (NADPH/NADH) small chain